MPILPSNFLNGIINRSDTAATQSNVQAAALTMSEANKQAVLDLVNSLSPQDTLVGKILYADSQNLSLETREGLVLNARNGGEIPLTKGETITFLVERTGVKNVTLRPLYQNVSKDQTTVIALKQAGIEVNARSIEMTARNMQYGLNVDRDSLLASYKDISLYPDAPVKDIVDLQRMGIEVNEMNLKQYSAYCNAEHSVTSALSSVSASFTDCVTNELLSLLPDEISIANEDSLPEEATLNMADYEPSSNKPVPSLDALLKFVDSIKDKPVSPEYIVSNGEIEVLKETISSFGLNTENLDNISTQEGSVTPAVALDAFLRDIKSSCNTFDSLKEFLLGAVNENNEEVLFNDNLSAFSDMVKSRVLENLVNRTFSSQWTLERSKTSEKAEIKDLYERLFTQTNEITNILKETFLLNEALATPINNLSDNLNFMNALNNFVPYIQIPFNNGEENKTGELYVFTNKKNLSQSGGEISAFIHLDMNNIGPTDVYVKLTDSDRISTNFTVRDEEILDFIEGHLDLLSKRLKEKGYSFNASFSTAETFESAIEKALNNTAQKLLISNTAFDARV